ncbi:sigma-54-dependent transcriptional regulator [Oleidesulfovibrio sp.]|uniref:sigma-54-dependent transcriptional regulator n=1 Tax=Oleidesulfovibrio sp. TaxID=2909707 RepID=UPI003A88E258
MTNNTNILIVDDDEAHRAMLRTMLRGWGYGITEADDGSVAVQKVQERAFDAILMDIRMARMSGIEALRHIMAHNPAIPVLIMTAYSSVNTAVEALKIGAYDYLTKPLDFDELKLTLERALDHTRLATENRELRDSISAGEAAARIIGRSEAVKQLTELVATVAPSEATVLITGESGTGKELVAKAIHEGSNRRTKPLVTVNCAALTESLLESELFGHEKGAFTGADRRREGRFLQADGGTLFLDELGEMSLSLQAKLLRALQQGEIQRVGSDNLLQVDVRVIAATNRNLPEEVAAGRFREDLFYRLNVIGVAVPALRERREDIPLLAGHFLTRYAERNRKMLKGFTPQAMNKLVKHDWPGNVRELENTVERAVIMSTSEYVTERELPANIAALAGDAVHDTAQPDTTDIVHDPYAGMSLEDLERRAIEATLRECADNKSEAARRLGITRATLHNKLKKYGME